ncbi:MAG: TIGR03032 family protein [Burkholderiaceae bacterium]|nr:TIGR03032 family protein [Burkholderiaceae bacterium]
MHNDIEQLAPEGKDPAPDGAVGLASVRAQERQEAKPTLYPSEQLGAWLNEVGGSLAFTTYQSARLFMIYADQNGQTHGAERIMGAAMGLAVDPRGMWVSNQQQAWRFSNLGPRTVGGVDFDAVYMPRKGYFLGPCDVHDILADVSFRGERHELLFVNTHYSCIAAIDEFYNFRPVWKPDFISAVSLGDRCHLNGMCARDGELAYATLCGRSDTPIGWKPMKGGEHGGGCVVDIASGQVVCEGLSMPHSPRWHEGRLWLLNSGAGDFGYVDFASGKFVAVARCPGFARGLAFVGDYAVIGLSKLRDNAFSAGLPVAPYLRERRIKETCGLLVIDTRTGALVHWLTIEGVVNELYDVAFLPGVRKPFTPGFSMPELHRALVHAPPGELAVTRPPFVAEH